MSALNDQYALAGAGQFPQRVQAAIVAAALSITNEIAIDQQTISGTATGGTGTVTVNGQATAALQSNMSASALQTAINALSSIGAGGVECTGGPLPGTPIVVNFVGSNLIGAQPVMSLGTGSLTGGTWSIAHTTSGVWAVNHAKRAALASKVLQNPVGYATLMAWGIASDASVQADYGAGGVNGVAAITDAHIANAASGQWNAYS